jgi:hypothetical protein
MSSPDTRSSDDRNLSDADISSQRNVSRRSALGSLGLAAAAIVVTAGAASAQTGGSNGGFDGKSVEPPPPPPTNPKTE